MRTKPKTGAADETARRVFGVTRTSQFLDYLRDLLVELCKVDTTPHPDVRKMREREAHCFSILERELAGLGIPEASSERRPISPHIRRHANYSQLHFTKTAARPQGLSAEYTYEGRSNLLYRVEGVGDRKTGRSVALNAHVDVVAPYLPPQVRGGVVFGRGACDDKGPVVAIVGALKALAFVMPKAGLRWQRNVLCMFVVEEETGGNGSLSLAIDPEIRALYDSVLVGECTGLKLHPANRGAVWYRAEIAAIKGASQLEMAAFINDEVEKEGAAIRAESRHALFPQRPVQTCHGIIGPFGEHPSRICGRVVFRLSFKDRPNLATEVLLHDCLDAAVAGYIGQYGDKTKVAEPSTGKPMIPRHYLLHRRGREFEIEVFGATGHMGAIRERDGAITKMAHLVRALVFSKARIESAAGAPVSIELAPVGRRKGQRNSVLVLEGGQGFVPTHKIEEVMQRIRTAAQRGAGIYLNRLGRPERGDAVVGVTYEKLHNVAFDGDPNSPTVRNALAAARACNLPKQEPVLGWTVSCDARLFATEYPGLPVLTFGPGELVHAHSDHEQIRLDDIRKAAEFLALFLLRETGTVC